MLQPFGDRGFPNAPLFAAGALIVFTLCVAGAGRLVGRAPDRPEGPALASRDLRFEDGADGSVAAFDARDGRLVTRFAPGTNGFLRGEPARTCPSPRLQWRLRSVVPSHGMGRRPSDA